MRIVQWGPLRLALLRELWIQLHYARATLFQRHAALLVANNAFCLMSGFAFEV